MKFATLPNGKPDGRLVIVSRDLKFAWDVSNIAATMQSALECWEEIEPILTPLYNALNDRSANGKVAFDQTAALAPLPRSWQWLDGSAYPSHGALMDKVFGVVPEKTSRPLMYQGISDQFLPGTADVPLPSEDEGIDFEGEFGVVVSEVPMGASPEKAASCIRLIMQINDWSLRKIAPVEMKTGFGWIQAKPVCSAAPVAVTPDELGDAWTDGRVHLPLNVWRNEDRFGAAHGGAMAYSFGELIAHAAHSRKLCTGTIIGSGTVSNENYRQVGSSCIAERRGIEMVDTGAPITGFMKFGERVRMDVSDSAGASIFGAIDQRVVSSKI